MPPLTLLGIIAFSDELRPHLQETLGSFTENGVKLKVISGDNPQTVAALAKQAGLPGDLQAVSGPELADMSPAEFAQTAVSSHRLRSHYAAAERGAGRSPCATRASMWP